MIQMGIRINKYIRDKGIASRREADQMIEQGSIFINGQRAKIGDIVNEGDEITVKGKQKDYQYLLYYKPRGLATQALGKTESVITIFAKQKLFPIGRLDKESEGLMILTNDGRVTSKIFDKSDKFEKEYLVKVREELRPGLEDIFKKGMDTKALGKLLPAKAKVLGSHLISISLVEGKRHQIRIMLAELGFTVTNLKRVRIGRMSLKDLTPGQTRPMTETEVMNILNG